MQDMSIVLIKLNTNLKTPLYFIYKLIKNVKLDFIHISPKHFFRHQDQYWNGGTMSS